MIGSGRSYLLKSLIARNPFPSTNLDVLELERFLHGLSLRLRLTRHICEPVFPGLIPVFLAQTFGRR